MPSIGLLSFSRIADDPRVRRQGDAFHAAGWTVFGVGVPGGRSPDPEWTLVGHEPGAPRAGADTSLRQAATTGGLRYSALAARLPPPLQAALGPFARLGHRGITAAKYLRAQRSFAGAEQAYWSFRHFAELYQRAASVEPDIWIANDWNTLPIAARLSARSGVPFGYDTHEFAATEYEQRRLWRLLQKPMTVFIEGGLIGQARVVSAVSPGIAEALRDMYALPSRPMTIYNTPSYERAEFRPTSEPARVLYHGVVAPGRGLEETIESVAHWRDGRTLTIRGPAEPAYAAKLARLRDAKGLGGRVRLEPPIPMTELVRGAQAFDIGILVLPGHSQHNAFALPNKLFEYTMAGLALCMSDLPEMTRVIGAHGNGTTFAGLTPEAIAAAINAMGAAEIDAYKRNSLAAARDLSWDEVSKPLVEAYQAILGAAGPRLREKPASA